MSVVWRARRFGVGHCGRCAPAVVAAAVLIGACLALPGAASAAPPGLASAWCGNGVGQPDVSNAKKWKVVYAYASDQPNRLATQPLVGQDIQLAMKGAADTMASESGNTTSVRIDQGSSCGDQYVDVVALGLPHTLSYYIGNTLKQGTGCSSDADCSISSFARLRDAMLDAGYLGNSGEPNDWLLFLDTMDQASVFPFFIGRGEWWLDSGNAGIANPTNDGYLFSVVWPEPDGAYGGLLSTDPVVRTAYPLHEMLHNIGAISTDAPHGTPNGHCWDHDEVMCYPDGGPWQSIATCGLKDGNWRYALTVDCGKDDYFNVSPTPGSYLATHWNTARSEFLCPVTWCGVRTASPLLTVTASSATPVPGSDFTITANATDSDGIARYDWDLDDVYGFDTTGGSSLTVNAGWGEGLTRVFRVRVSDPSGAFTVSEVAVTPTTPPPPQPDTGNSGRDNGTLPPVTPTPRAPQPSIGTVLTRPEPAGARVHLSFAGETPALQSTRDVLRRGLLVTGLLSGATSAKVVVRYARRVVARRTLRPDSTEEARGRLRLSGAVRGLLKSRPRKRVKLQVTISSGGVTERFSVLCVAKASTS